MNIVDLLIICIMLLCAWTAYRRGLILSGLGLLTSIIILLTAFLLYKPGGVIILKFFPRVGSWSPALAFFVLIILAQICYDTLVISFLRRLPQGISQSQWNHVLGIVPGLINGFIWITLMSAFLIAYPLENVVTRSARKSKFAPQLAGNVGWLNKQLSPVLTGALMQLRDNNAAVVSHERMITLPFRVADAQPRPELEAELLRLVNKERTNRGLQPLQADAGLTKVAREHSEDMFRRGYFSHYTPDGLDPLDRMKKDSIQFLIGGENIAITQTLPMAHTGLMRSPGHRANILNPAYGYVGIGILDGGFYGLMITQSFKN